MISCRRSEHLRQICRVKASAQALLRQGFLDWAQAQQVHGDLPHDIQVVRRMVGARAAPVFAKRHIQAPMQPVLDFPVTTYRVRQSFRVRRQRADEVTPLCRDASFCLAHRFNHDHALYPGPSIERFARRTSQRHAAAPFDAAMPGFFGRMPPIGEFGIVLPLRHVEQATNRFMQRSLVAFESEYVALDTRQADEGFPLFGPSA